MVRRRDYQKVGYAVARRTVEGIGMLSRAWGLPKGRVIDRLVAQEVDGVAVSVSGRLERLITELGLIRAELDFEEDRPDPGEWPVL